MQVKHGCLQPAGLSLIPTFAFTRVVLADRIFVRAAMCLTEVLAGPRSAPRRLR